FSSFFLPDDWSGCWVSPSWKTRFPMRLPLLTEEIAAQDYRISALFRAVAIEGPDLLVCFIQCHRAEQAQRSLVRDHGKITSVRREGDQRYGIIELEIGQWPAAGKIPELDRFVLATAGQGVAVGRKGQRSNGRLMPTD